MGGLWADDAGLTSVKKKVFKNGRSRGVEMEEK